MFNIIKNLQQKKKKNRLGQHSSVISFVHLVKLSQTYMGQIFFFWQIRGKMTLVMELFNRRVSPLWDIYVYML